MSVSDIEEEMREIYEIELSDVYKRQPRNWQCDITPAVEELGFSPEYDLCLLYTYRCV